MADFTYKVGEGGSSARPKGRVVHSSLLVTKNLAEAIQKAEADFSRHAYWEGADRIWLEDAAGHVVWSKTV